MGELEVYQNYEQYKKELDGELQKTAEGFVRIGYLLKVARDTNILAESGYKTVAEFAEAEYNLDKTQVSRFISINDKFSENGNSDRLLPEYQGYGYAKLTIMLQIPTEIAEELSPNLSKADIQAIKEEIDEERKISDIEVALEAKRWDLEDMTLLEKVIYLLMDENGEEKLYRKIWDAYRRWGIDDKTIRPIMAPSGEKVYSVRIPGTGRVMMIMDDAKDEISITNTRTSEKEVFSWLDVAETAAMMADPGKETMEECWEEIYGKPWPWKEEVAPVQQTQKPEPKKEPKKESKVQKAKKPEKPKKPSTEQTPAAVVEEEQLPGQMSVEDYPELIPETSYEEVKEVQDERNNESGMPGSAGDEADHGEPNGVEETAGGETKSIPEGDGASEGGGCEADHGYKEMKPFWEALEDIGNAMERLEAMFPEEDFDDKLDAMSIEELKAAHKEALKLAAGIEKMMIWRHLKNEG